MTSLFRARRARPSTPAVALWLLLTPFAPLRAAAPDDANIERIIARLPPPPSAAPNATTSNASASNASPLRASEPASGAPVFSSEPLATLVRRCNLSLPLPDANIVVYKSARRLDLRSGGTIVKSYTVALGGAPAGDKTRRGDSRTPEGEFYICTRNATTSAFHIFLGLSYPALPDAVRGLQAGRIDRREYDLIQQRLENGQAPLWETKLGGWIGIHGGSDAPFARKKKRERGSSDWTAGCIALTDAEIEELYAATRLRTPVLVLP